MFPGSLAYRRVSGQVRQVQVHRLLISDGVDQRMLEMLDLKQRLFNEFAARSHIADSSPEAVDVSEASLAKQVIAKEQGRLDTEMMDRLAASSD